MFVVDDEPGEANAGRYGNPGDLFLCLGAIEQQPALAVFLAAPGMEGPSYRAGKGDPFVGRLAHFRPAVMRAP